MNLHLIPLNISKQRNQTSERRGETHVYILYYGRPNYERMNFFSAEIARILRMLFFHPQLLNFVY